MRQMPRGTAATPADSSCRPERVDAGAGACRGKPASLSTSDAYAQSAHGGLAGQIGRDPDSAGLDLIFRSRLTDDAGCHSPERRISSVCNQRLAESDSWGLGGHHRLHRVLSLDLPVECRVRRFRSLASTSCSDEPPGLPRPGRRVLSTLTTTAVVSPSSPAESPSARSLGTVSTPGRLPGVARRLDN